jgi:MoxR-like ATPase
VDYAVDLARATRPNEPESPDFVKKWLAWGAGPRAAQYLILGAKARAIMKGRFAVQAADVRALAKPVLRHRVFTNFTADAEGIDVDQVVEKVLGTVAEPAYGERPTPPTAIVIGKEIEPAAMGTPVQAAPGVAPPEHVPAPAVQAAAIAPPPAPPSPPPAEPPDTFGWPPGTRPERR